MKLKDWILVSRIFWRGIFLVVYLDASQFFRCWKIREKFEKSESFSLPLTQPLYIPFWIFSRIFENEKLHLKQFSIRIDEF